MKTIAIINMKGGCAKTTTAVNMAYILARDYDKKVLVSLQSCAAISSIRFCFVQQASRTPGRNLTALLCILNIPFSCFLVCRLLKQAALLIHL